MRKRLTIPMSQSEAEKLLKLADASARGSLFKSKDLEKASLLYDDASKMFQSVRLFHKAVLAKERCAESNEETNNVFLAARSYDQCVLLASRAVLETKELDVNDSNAIQLLSDFAARASACYASSSRMQQSGECLAKCARILEKLGVKGEETSVSLYERVLDVLCENELELYASDAFRALCALRCKTGAFREAAELCVRFAVACDKISSTATQRRCYLHAIIAYLWVGDVKEAELSYADFMEIDAFANSEESLISYELLRGYKEEDAGMIETTWRERRVPEIADACFSRLKLPNPAFPLKGGSMMMMGRGGGGKEEEDDDDLT